jgi:hypothetical protein
MNRNLKRGLVAVALLGATGIGAGMVLAEGGMACEHGPGMMRAARHGDVRAVADAKLDRLHAALQLRADQQEEWKAFRTVIDRQADQMGEKLRGWRDAAPAVTAVERLDHAQKGLEEGRAALAEVAAATRRFYAALDKDQKARFDEQTRRLGPGRPGFGHGPGA